MKKLVLFSAGLILALGAAAGAAMAGDVTFTITGTYANNVPVTSYSEPGGSYTISFTTPEMPSTLPSFTYLADEGFTFDTDFTISLNSTPLQLFSNVPVVFFNSDYNGGLLLCLDPSCDGYWSIAGDVLYTGDPSDPTLQPGMPNINYALSGYDLMPDDNGPFPFTDGTLTVVGSTPEPSSLLLLATGLLAFGAAFRFRHA